MGYPVSPPPAPARSGPDLAVSIAVLALTVVLGVTAAFLGLVSIAFLDYCPPERCSVDNAVAAVGTALIAAAVIGVLGLTITVVRLYRRRRAWPVAVVTLALCLVAFVAGGVGYAVAVGA